MKYPLSQLSNEARLAVEHANWPRVANLAQLMVKEYSDNAEGYFLAGIAEKARSNTSQARQLFKQALRLDNSRHDAAIELAQQYLFSSEFSSAYELLVEFEKKIKKSPLYLHMAARVYSGIGLHSRAWPLYQRALKIQPDVDMFRESLAGCAVFNGKIDYAIDLYKLLIKRYPTHQKNHYELSKLIKATDDKHVQQMKNILNKSQKLPEHNIYLYYAIAKELEDLQDWSESFTYYEKAGNAVTKVANYNVDEDIEVINEIIDVCNESWLNEKTDQYNTNTKTPIFILGMPRTGTTLVDRILSSHTKVESADETFFMQYALRNVCNQSGMGDLTKDIITSAAKVDINTIRDSYLRSIQYLLSDKPMFIDKYPFNFLYIGFIAKAFPEAKIIYLKRNPMDTCFALYKQSFFKFAYDLNNLGKYYVAQNRLREHWESLLPNRIFSISYEDIIQSQDKQTRALLNYCGLDFEERTLSFEKNKASCASASTVQVREKLHSRSINKWKHYEAHLKPLTSYLEKSGISF